ncbi:uncharacterized protein N7479_004644 [Penicillium vulpinum]|uniref:Uncharacterized protein n=1 Tax=Penicillium vulpinum TaxID=29845 RepID=A0A1V6RLT7_9EURO|nr:uncharacterized protein N7479_004644 [Penicillium vulpinum]KAJ5964768.1 hypothetical protein N7479_004644 [Penicillium vulpinum]OQE02797.1 hypothetical protein PENVUL_c038G09656 [Penicillium vulpinum]
MPPTKIEKKKATTKKKIVQAILDIKINKFSFSQLRASVAQLTSMVQNEEYELPTLAISSLNIDDVQSTLNIKFSLNNLEFRDQGQIEFSPSFGTYTQTRIEVNATSDQFEKAEWTEKTIKAFENSDANEAMSRVILNNLLTFSHDYVTSKSDSTGHDVHLNAEGLWRYGPVTYKGAKYDLTGRPDYTLWYGTEAEVAVSVVVVEAKSGASAMSGVSQALAYMGCVHRRRKDLMKTDTTVYGVATDGQYFVFLKINNNSEWSEYIISARNNNFQEVIGLLVHIFRTAMTISPLQSEETSLASHSKESSSLSYIEFDAEEEVDSEEEI